VCELLDDLADALTDRTYLPHTLGSLATT
jgi:hypothetical protein